MRTSRILRSRPAATSQVLRRGVAAAAAVAGAVGLAVSGAAPAGAEVIRPNCTPAGGLYSAAQHPGACWRPFSATSPFNRRLLTNDPRVESNSAQIVNRLNGFGEPGTLSFGPGPTGTGFGQKAVYFARPTDPLVKIKLRQDNRNGGTWGESEMNGVSIRVPEGATPSQGSDHHMVVVDQQTGWNYEMWQVTGKAKGGTTLSAEWGGRTRMDGTGETIGSGTATAAGLSLLGGLLRPEELLEGDIPHALYLTVHCTNGRSVAPSLRPPVDPENACSNNGMPDANAPALGQRFQLGYTDEQIANLPVPAHAKVLLRAMAHYGLIVVDGTEDAWHIDSEASLDRTSLGEVDPGVEFGKRSGLPSWDGGKQYLWDIAQIPGVDGRAGSWSKALRVLKPCVSDGSCPPPTAPDTAPDPLWPVGSSSTPLGTSSAAPVAAASEVVKASATVSATVAVSSPVPATATATVTATATAPLQTTSKAPKIVKKAKAKARVKAKAKARAKAKTRAKAKARTRATARARARHARAAR